MILGRGTARLRCFSSSASSISFSPLSRFLFRAVCPFLPWTCRCLPSALLLGHSSECCQCSLFLVKPGYERTCQLWLWGVSTFPPTCLIINPSLSSPGFAFFMRDRRGGAQRPGCESALIGVCW